MSADINFSAFSGHQSQRRVRYIESEINQDKVVNPTFFDEVDPKLFDNPTAINMFKAIGNSRRGVHPAGVMVSNASMSGLKKELQKRIQYVSIVGDFLEEDDRPIDYQQLSTQITDHIYREVVSRLNDRLIDVSEEDFKLLRKDYLALTRAILRDIKERARSNWPTKILTADPSHILMMRSDSKTATIAEHVFKPNTGYNKSGLNEEMDAYANMLPRGVVLRRADNNLQVDIDRFDKAVGEPILRTIWEDRFRTDMTVDEVKRQQDATQETLSQVVQLLAEREAKPKGFFGRIFGK